MAAASPRNISAVHALLLALFVRIVVHVSGGTEGAGISVAISQRRVLYMVNIPDEAHGEPWIRRVLEPIHGQGDLLLVIYNPDDKPCGLAWDRGPGKLYCLRIPSQTFTRGRNDNAREAFRIEAERGAAYDYWIMADWDTMLGLKNPAFMPKWLEPYEAFEAAILSLQAPVIVPGYDPFDQGIMSPPPPPLPDEKKTRLLCSQATPNSNGVARVDGSQMVTHVVNVTATPGTASLPFVSPAPPPLLTCQPMNPLPVNEEQQGGAHPPVQNCCQQSSIPLKKSKEKIQGTAGLVLLSCNPPVIFKPGEVVVYVTMQQPSVAKHAGDGSDQQQQLQPGPATSNCSSSSSMQQQQQQQQQPDPRGFPLRLFTASKVDFCFMALHRRAVPVLLPLHNLDDATWWGSIECWWAGMTCFDFATLVLGDIWVLNQAHSTNYKGGHLSPDDLKKAVHERYGGLMEVGVLKYEEAYAGPLGLDYNAQPSMPRYLLDSRWQVADKFRTCERVLGPTFDAFAGNSTCHLAC
eukprot:jgi/Mesvir1/13807/Mv15961-RA.1